MFFPLLFSRYVVEGLISCLAVSFALFEWIEFEHKRESYDIATSSQQVLENLYSDYYLITRCLAILRVVPLLRLINEFRSIRIVLTSIYQSFAYIGHLCVVVLCVWYMWASVGVELFGGILRQPEVVDGDSDYINSGA